MDTDQYGQWVENKMLTKGNERLVENTLGLVGEAGEVAEKVKKLFRDSTRFTTEDIESELGDVLFYLTAIANHLGSSLTDVMSNNIVKLDDRAQRGVLKGSGDNR